MQSINYLIYFLLFFSYPRHATSQYEARQFSQSEIEQHISSKGFQTFLSKASLR